MKVYVKYLQKIGKHDSTCNRGITSRPSHTFFLLFCFFCLRRPTNPRNACHFLYKRERRSSTFFYFFNSFNRKKSMSIVTAFPGIDVSVIYPLSFLLSRKVLVPGSLQFISSRLLHRLPCHYRFKHLMLLIIQLEYCVLSSIYYKFLYTVVVFLVNGKNK